VNRGVLRAAVAGRQCWPAASDGRIWAGPPASPLNMRLNSFGPINDIGAAGGSAKEGAPTTLVAATEYHPSR
jgi:hypothetical protein